MKLTTKGRYAVTAILDLVVYGGSEPLNLAEIAERQKISPSYLEQLFSLLRRAEVVESFRGPGGGYRLVGSPKDLTVMRVLKAAGEGVDMTRCEGDADCCCGEPCLTHPLWLALDRILNQFLDGMNFALLAEMVNRHRTQSEQSAIDMLLATTTGEAGD